MVFCQFTTRGQERRVLCRNALCIPNLFHHHKGAYMPRTDALPNIGSESFTPESPESLSSPPSHALFITSWRPGRKNSWERSLPLPLDHATALLEERQRCGYQAKMKRLAFEPPRSRKDRPHCVRISHAMQTRVVSRR